MSPPNDNHHDDRHRAVLYSTPDEFADWAVPFVRHGLDAGERVLAVSGPRNTKLLQRRLRSADGAVEYKESDHWYTTPARTMAAFDNYVLEHEDRGRGVRNPLAGHLRPNPMAEPENGFGIWLARQLCEHVEVRADPGWVVRSYTRKKR